MLFYIIISIMYIITILSMIPFFTFSSKQSSNDIFGFRTKTASKSKESWEYANLYYANIIRKSIVLYILIIVLVGIRLNYFTNISESDEELSVMIISISFLLIVIVSGIFTQIKTKQFNDSHNI